MVFSSPYNLPLLTLQSFQPAQVEDMGQKRRKDTNGPIDLSGPSSDVGSARTLMRGDGEGENKIDGLPRDGHDHDTYGDSTLNDANRRIAL